VQRNERELIAEQAVALVQQWLEESKREGSRSPAEKRLAKILKDPNGLDWTLKFVDRVIRPSDRKVASIELAQLSKDLPKSLSLLDRMTIRIGGLLAKPFSFIVIPTAKARLRQLVGHLIADARPGKLTKHIAKSKSDGIRLNLNLLGEAVLGEAEANYRYEETFNLLRRPDVDYVSIKLSAVASQLSMWGFEQTVQRLVDKLTPLYEYAASQPTPKFINLDMEEYRDLGLTMLVFKKLLSKEQLHNLEAGIVLQAYLPDSFEALKELTDFAQTRTANGGAGIKVRIVKGANLAMEIVDANWHGWELATYSTKAQSDANYKRLIDYSLDKNRIKSLRVGIAGHNLFDLAFAHKLSIAREVSDRVEFEMLQGMAQHLSAQVKNSVGSLLLYTPVVRPSEFQVAVAYLTRRLEENGSPENFMSGVFDITTDRNVFDRERMRFETSLRTMDELGPAQNRTQNRLNEKTVTNRIFSNASDTDPALANNRDWIRQVLAGAKALVGKLQSHESHVAKAAIETYELEELITDARNAASSWASDAEHRKQILLKVGAELANSRGPLLQLMIAEAGKTIGEADAELSEAIDFANFYAHSIDEITTTERLDGVTFIPHRLVVVTPPWNFPVAIAAGGVLAGLAAGAAVIIKPAPQVVNCVIAMVETLWRAGVPKDVLKIAIVPDNELGLQLVGNTNVDSVILTGAFETAQLFKNYRPRMNLAAETSGKNAIVISPFADLDLAANDLAKSAFGHAGQKCSAASLGILIGSVYQNKQFLKQLVDCVESMKVGYGPQADATVGPLIEPPSPKLLRALTQLDKGESWLLEPKQLDDSGRLWRPGIKIGVQPGSFFHLTEVFGPVLGIMKAKDLENALEIQNATDFGLTAGIHSLNTDEIKYWLDNIDAGNLYVNRGITGAIVERQPFGGFKRSSVGYGLKAGGRNYLLQFGHFEDSADVQLDTKLNVDEWEQMLALVEPEKLGWLHQAIRSDSYWREKLYRPKTLDAGTLEVEGNYHRYLPSADKNIIIRVSRHATKAELVRVLVAVAQVGFTLSIHPGFQMANQLTDDQLSELKGTDGGRCAIQTEDEFVAAIRKVQPGTKLFVIGAKEPQLDDLQANPDLFVIDTPITKSGRAMQLAFYREQSISITQHRFGAISSELLNIFKPLV
jgi:RHH-type proline utilization regulon transcriptional repressor/proline dehydrogenase/delta 1-pyrroline-5-carboxylate dehydrogenase